MRKFNNNSGFTLIELIVVIVIIGVLASIAIPNYGSYVESNKAQAAENNLMAIAAAESKYYEDYNSYCTSTTDYNNIAPFCDTPTHINANLHLGLSTNDPFFANYSCSAAGSVYSCTTTDGADTINLTVNLDANGKPSGVTVTCDPVGSSCPS